MARPLECGTAYETGKEVMEGRESPYVGVAVGWPLVGLRCGVGGHNGIVDRMLCNHTAHLSGSSLSLS